jgi:hypothetical protein
MHATFTLFHKTMDKAISLSVNFYQVYEAEQAAPLFFGKGPFCSDPNGAMRCIII